MKDVLIVKKANEDVNVGMMNNIYEIEIYDENVFKETHPVWNDILHGIIKEYGIDISKYYFSQCLGYMKDRLEISFVSNYDKDTSLTIEFVERDTSCILEKIQLEND